MKIQAEPGARRVERPRATEAERQRWVGSGWMVFNNKGKPVRQYEPFFTAHPPLRVRRAMTGVSPSSSTTRSSASSPPCTRTTRTRRWSSIPGDRSSYDVNDTVAFDPSTDDDVGGYVRAYFATQPPTWQTWRAMRIAGALGPHEQSAATKAAAHADTPTTTWLDTLGRTFLTAADNGQDPVGRRQLFRTRVYLDIEGNQREVRDALTRSGSPQGRLVMRYSYDMLGNRTRQASMEAGSGGCSTMWWATRFAPGTAGAIPSARPTIPCAGPSAASSPAPTPPTRPRRASQSASYMASSTRRARRSTCAARRTCTSTRPG